MTRPDAHHPTSEELFAYRDGELSHERRTLIEAHVLVCAQCRDRVDEMSALESDLRMRPDDVGEEYYERLTQAVLARAGKARAGEASAEEEAPAEAQAAGPRAGRARAGRARAAEPAHPYERRRPDAVSEEGGGRRRLRLPWIGIAGSGAAAAAVMIVAVILFQRQGEWVRAPRPAVLGDRETAVSEKRTPAREDAGARARSRENAAGMGTKKTDAKNAPPSPKAGVAQAPVGLAAPTPQRKLRTAPEGAREEDAGKDEAEPDLVGEVAPKMDALQKSAEQDLDSAAAPPAERQQATGAADGEPLHTRGGGEVRSVVPSAPAAPGAPGEAYARVLREYALPPVWNSGVSKDALLEAEPELRRVYQTRRAGADSARIRLYLAEAERAKLGASPDPARLDTAVNHYRRAISLAISRGDLALADLARRRLASLFGTTPANPAPSGTP